MRSCPAAVLLLLQAAVCAAELPLASPSQAQVLAWCAAEAPASVAQAARFVDDQNWRTATGVDEAALAKPEWQRCVARVNAARRARKTAGMGRLESSTALSARTLAAHPNAAGIVYHNANRADEPAAVMGSPGRPAPPKPPAATGRSRARAPQTVPSPLGPVPPGQVGQAYDRISARILDLIRQAPDPSRNDAEASAAWRRQWAELQEALLERGGGGAEWAKAERLWLAADAQTQQQAAESRERASQLRKMLAALVEQGIDPSVWSAGVREQALIGQGRPGAFGFVIQAIFQDQRRSGAQVKALLQKLQQLDVLSADLDPERAAQALAGFYDADGNAKWFEGTPVAGLMARWAAARKQAGGPASTGAPSPQELSRQALQELQLLAQAELEPDDVKKQMALLYLRHYNLNESAFDYLSLHGASSDAERRFLEEFAKARGQPKSPDQLAEQQRLTDLIKGLLSDLDEIKEMDAADAASRSLVQTLAALPEELRRALQAEGSPDIQTLIDRQRREPLLRWAITAREGGLFTGTDDEWIALERDVAADVYTKGYAAAVSAQSQRLTQQAEAAKSHPTPAAFDELARTLEGIENPQFVTPGFLRKVLELSRPGVPRLSSRDEQLLEAWRQLQQTLAASSAAQGVLRAAPNPPDAETLVRALRLAGVPVYDRRLLGVAVAPSSAASPADQAALAQLRSHYNVADGALLGALLGDLAGPRAKQQEAYRLDELLRSTSDITRRQYAQLERTVGALASRPGALQQLTDLAERLRADREAEDAVWRRDQANQATPEGRARALLVSRFLAVKTQSQLSISFHSDDPSANDRMEGFSVSGWLLGRPDAERVVRHVHHLTGDRVPGSPQPGAIANPITGATLAAPGVGPKGGRDGLTYLLAEGAGRDFVSLDGRASERVRPTFDPEDASARVYVDDTGRVVYRKADGSGAFYEKDPLTAFSGPHALALSQANAREVETVSVQVGAASYTLTQYQAKGGDTVRLGGQPKRVGRDQTLLLKYERQTKDGMSVVDYQARTMTEYRQAKGGLKPSVQYQLDAAGQKLADDRAHTVFQNGRPIFSESIVNGELHRQDLAGDASITKTFRMPLEGGDLNQFMKEELLGHKHAGIPSSAALISASVRIDPAKFKTESARQQERRRVLDELVRLNLVAGAERAGEHTRSLMEFYDGARGGQVYDVAFDFAAGEPGNGSGNGLTVSKFAYDRSKRETRVETHSFRYVPELPKKPSWIAQQLGDSGGDPLLTLLRDKTGMSEGYIEYTEGRPSGFFWLSGRYRGYHTISVGDKEGENDGRWYWASDIVRRVRVDGGEIGRLQEGETWSLWRTGSWLGEKANGWIQSTQWAKDHPMWAAVVGGVAMGAFSILDLKQMGIMLGTGGSGFIVDLLANASSKTLVVIRTVMKVVNSATKAYFDVQMAIMKAQAIVYIPLGVIRQDPHMLQQGVTSLVTWKVMDGTFHLLGRAGVPGFGEGPGKVNEERPGGTVRDTEGTPRGPPSSGTSEKSSETPRRTESGSGTSQSNPHPTETASAPHGGEVGQTKVTPNPQTPAPHPGSATPVETGSPSGGSDRALTVTARPETVARPELSEGTLSHPEASKLPEGNPEARGSNTPFFGLGGAKAEKPAEPVHVAPPHGETRGESAPPPKDNAAAPKDAGPEARGATASPPAAAEPVAPAESAPPRQVVEAARFQAERDREVQKMEQVSAEKAGEKASKAEDVAKREREKSDELQRRLIEARDEVKKARDDGGSKREIRKKETKAERLSQKASQANERAQSAESAAADLRTDARIKDAGARLARDRAAQTRALYEQLSEKASGQPVAPQRWHQPSRWKGALSDWIARRDARLEAREGRFANTGTGRRLATLGDWAADLGVGPFTLRGTTLFAGRILQTTGLLIERTSLVVDAMKAQGRSVVGWVGRALGWQGLIRFGTVAYEPTTRARLQEVRKTVKGPDGKKIATTELEPVSPGTFQGLLQHVGRMLQGRFMPDGRPLGRFAEIWRSRRAARKLAERADFQPQALLDELKRDPALRRRLEESSVTDGFTREQDARRALEQLERTWAQNLPEGVDAGFMRVLLALRETGESGALRSQLRRQGYSRAQIRLAEALVAADPIGPLLGAEAAERPAALDQAAAVVEAAAKRAGIKPQDFLKHAEVFRLSDPAEALIASLRDRFDPKAARGGQTTSPTRPAAPPLTPTRMTLDRVESYQVPDKAQVAVRLPGAQGQGEYLRLNRDGAGWSVDFQGRRYDVRSPETLHVGRGPPPSLGPGERYLKASAPGPDGALVTVEFAPDGRVGVVSRTAEALEVSQPLRVSSLIEGRQANILGRLFSTERGEIIRADIKTDPELPRVYREIRKSRAANRSRRRGREAELPLLQRVKDVLAREIPYDADRANELELVNNFTQLVGDANLAGRKGVCRHQAFAAATILDALRADGYLEGQVYYVVGGVHAWAEYVTPEGKSYVLDVAQNYIGPADGVDFMGKDLSSGSGRSSRSYRDKTFRYTDFQRNAQPDQPASRDASRVQPDERQAQTPPEKEPGFLRRLFTRRPPEPEPDRISEAGARLVLKRAQFRDAPGKPTPDGKAILKLFDELELLPRHKVVLGDAAFYLTDAIPESGGRKQVIGFVERPGQPAQARLFYTSRSQGLWRVYDAETSEGNIAKGYHEFDTNLPIELTAKLQWIADNRFTGEPRHSYFDTLGLKKGEAESRYQRALAIHNAFLGVNGADVGLARHLIESDPKKISQSAAMSKGYTSEVAAEPVALGGVEGEPNLRSQRGLQWASPEQVRLPPQEKLPNFSKKVYEFSSDNPSYAQVNGGDGRLTMEIYDSRDGTARYLFARDSKGRAAAVAVEKMDAALTSFGVRAQYYDQSGVAAPLMEYPEQAPFGYGDRSQTRGEYVSNWDYVRELPIVREYYKAKGEKIPPANDPTLEGDPLRAAKAVGALSEPERRAALAKQAFTWTENGQRRRGRLSEEMIKGVLEAHDEANALGLRRAIGEKGSPEQLKAKLKLLIKKYGVPPEVAGKLVRDGWAGAARAPESGAAGNAELLKRPGALTRGYRRALALVASRYRVPESVAQSLPAGRLVGVDLRAPALKTGAVRLIHGTNFANPDWHEGGAHNPWDADSPELVVAGRSVPPGLSAVTEASANSRLDPAGYAQQPRGARQVGESFPFLIEVAAPRALAARWWVDFMGHYVIPPGTRLRRVGRTFEKGVPVFHYEVEEAPEPPSTRRVSAAGKPTPRQQPLAAAAQNTLAPALEAALPIPLKRPPPLDGAESALSRRVDGAHYLETGDRADYERYAPEQVKKDDLPAFVERMKSSSGHAGIHIFTDDGRVRRIVDNGYFSSRLAGSLRGEIPEGPERGLHNASLGVHFSVDRPFHQFFDQPYAAFVAPVEALMESKAALNMPLLDDPSFAGAERFKTQGGWPVPNQDWVLSGFQDDLFDRSQRFYLDELGVLLLPQARKAQFEGMFQELGRRPARVFYYKAGGIEGGIAEFRALAWPKSPSNTIRLSGQVSFLGRRGGPYADILSGQGDLYGVASDWSPARLGPQPIDKPLDGDALAQMAENLLGIGKVNNGWLRGHIPRLAEKLVDEALQLNPGSNKAHFLRAERMPERSRDEIAAKRNEYALALGSDRSDQFHAWRTIARLDAQLGDFDSARAALEKAGELAENAPDERWARWIKGDGQTLDAVEPIRRTLGVSPADRGTDVGSDLPQRALALAQRVVESFATQSGKIKLGLERGSIEPRGQQAVNARRRSIASEQLSELKTIAGGYGVPYSNSRPFQDRIDALVPALHESATEVDDSILGAFAAAHEVEPEIVDDPSTWINGSGDSAASMEAINRAQANEFLILDRSGGVVRRLGLEGVDFDRRNLQPGQRYVSRNKKTGAVTVLAGDSPVSAQALDGAKDFEFLIIRKSGKIEPVPAADGVDYQPKLRWGDRYVRKDKKTGAVTVLERR